MYFDDLKPGMSVEIAPAVVYFIGYAFRRSADKKSEKKQPQHTM